jgi:hypothetical protein
MTEKTLPFLRVSGFDQRELVGARWWHVALAKGGDVSRRKALKTIGIAVGGVSLLSLLINAMTDCGDDGVSESQQDALALQRAEGWDVGSKDLTVRFDDVQMQDCAQSTRWIKTSMILEQQMAPSRPELRPYYVPTLFQSLTSLRNMRLAVAVKPICSAAMIAAYSRGESMASLFDEEAKGVALVVDLPGPEAVAFAAGLLPRFDPIFLFDNWPHPRGVVSSHLTIGAALYYAARFQDVPRTPTALPAFVLDSNRLLPYTDNARQFDNRYLARLPSSDALRALGVAHLLYVRPDSATMRELDDLNDYLCSLGGKPDVKVAVLDDFREDDDDVEVDPSSGTRRRSGRSYYGGSRGSHLSFWRSYLWLSPMLTQRPADAARVSSAFRYAPTRRTTIFGGAPAAGAVGRVTVGKTRSGALASLGRSGSLGRVGSYSGRSGGFGGG